MKLSCEHYNLTESEHCQGLRKWSIFVAPSDMNSIRPGLVRETLLRGDKDSMKRTTIASLLLLLIFLTATSLQSQTRPRRVGPAVNPPVEEPISRPRERNWMRDVLRTSAASGLSRGRSCTPSRDIFRSRPRL